MARTRKLTPVQAREQGIRYRRIVRWDEGFLVDYGCGRMQDGARRGRLTPNLAREYARTHDAISEITEGLAGTRIVGIVTPEQEALEEEYFQAKVERWERERIEDEIEAAYAHQHGDPYYYEYEDEGDWREWEAEYARENEVVTAMHTVRAWLNTRAVR
jgi:hypothetical protein